MGKIYGTAAGVRHHRALHRQPNAIGGQEQDLAAATRGGDTMSGGRMPDWTAVEDTHLATLREQGMSTPAIAECFENRSFHSIKNRIYTLRGRGAIR